MMSLEQKLSDVRSLMEQDETEIAELEASIVRSQSRIRCLTARLGRYEQTINLLEQRAALGGRDVGAPARNYG